METLSSPIRLSIDVTSRCNLTCWHCRHRGRAQNGSDLSFEQIVRIVDDASQMGVFRLVISGGEPFLRTDVIDILLHALTSAVGRVFVSANGLSVYDHELKPLGRFRDRLTFKISIDGSPRCHDRIRGVRGACATARRTVERLLADGFDVQITTTLMKDNVGDLGRLLEWSSRCGCSKHYVVEAVPVGQAAMALGLTRDERERAQALIQEARSRRNGKCAIIAKLPFGDGSPGFVCSGGTEECGVLADGSIVGCRLMPDLVEGNVRDSSLRRIWSDPRRFGLFRRISRRKLDDACKECDRSPSCFGGCHAYARAVHGSFYSPDPRCPLPTATALPPQNTNQAIRQASV
jgi:radical SAM protein with 4Fe4S-binding SPASM domain